MRNITQFKERFQRWKKTGELPYEAGRIKNADSNREEQVYEDSISLSALPAYEGGKDGTILNHDYANDVFTGARLFNGQDILTTVEISGFSASDKGKVLGVVNGSWHG